jgi:hypothetical protein
MAILGNPGMEKLRLAAIVRVKYRLE